MSATFSGGRLHALTPVLVTGVDARKFLQGQLTSDLRKLTPERALLASCTSGQGRVMTVLTLIERPEGIFAIIPSATLEPILLRMRRMLLRSQLSFDERPQGWALTAVTASAAADVFATLPELPGACVAGANASLLRWWSSEERYLLLATGALPGLANDEASLCDVHWHRADVAAGLPAVYEATRESFVPQMLNLDLLHGVSYDKGCYVGQEVVARARRAQVKRRMFRYSASGPAPAPGTRVVLEQREVGEVVDSAETPCGCELLAVVDIAHSHAALELPGGWALSRLPVPYQSVQ